MCVTVSVCVYVCVIIFWVFGVECLVLMYAFKVLVLFISSFFSSFFLCVCVCADCHDFVDVDNVHHHKLITLYGA